MRVQHETLLRSQYILQPRSQHDWNGTVPESERGGRRGGASQARPHLHMSSNIVRLREEQKERGSVLPPAQCDSFMALFQCLYSALISVCDRWIHLCE